VSADVEEVMQTLGIRKYDTGDGVIDGDQKGRTVCAVLLYELSTQQEGD